MAMSEIKPQQLQKPQFIIYYPPGETYIEDELTDNNTIAKDLLRNLINGASIAWPQIKGWRIAQRNKDGYFEEIFPEPQTQYMNLAECQNCDLSFLYDKEDIELLKSGEEYVECERCHNWIKIRGSTDEQRQDNSTDGTVV